MLTVRAIVALAVLTGLAMAQTHVSFPTEDGQTVVADLYGKSARGVVLAHGGRFKKESWEKQARVLEDAGFSALAIEFRTQDTGDQGYAMDVLAAVRYLHRNGASNVSVVGASFGGSAAAQASIDSHPGEIDRIILLAASTDAPEKLKGRKLFIVARDDANDDGPRLPKIQANYEKAKEPKQLIILEGSAHAQFLFDTDQGGRLLREILKFLTAP